MSTIVTRAGKGSTLTFAEVDANFTNLNTDKLEFSSEPVRHSVRPSLLLDFANTKQLDPRITFTRASTATFYDGRTTAKAEENLFTYSQELNTFWTVDRGTITANTDFAPDGTTTADTLTATSVNGQVYQPITATATAYTVSAWIRRKTGTGNIYLNFGSVISSALSVTTSWQRFTFTYTIPSNGVYYPGVRVETSGDEVYVWGAQLEQRSSVTAYTPTTTAAITNYIPALQTAASGVARFDHNPTTGESLGLLIEEQRVNVVLRSEDFTTTWGLSSATVNSNTIIAPDGTLTGDKLVEDTTSNIHWALQSSITVSSGISYTYSVYVKQGERSFVRIVDGVRGSVAIFNLSTGALVSNINCTGNITLVGNGWYRCSITYTTTSTFADIYIQPCSNSTTFNYLGDGFSGIYIWGAQLEAGAFATSYIPTVASQVTRSPDAASLTGTNFSSWYRQDEGTVYSETFNAQTVPASTFPGVWRMNDGANNNRISLYITSAATYVGVVRGGSAQGTTVNIITTANTSLKNAYVYKSKDFAMSTNAGTVATVSSGEIPILTQFLLSTGDEAGRQLWHKKIAFYPKRLTNAELQGLTTV